MTLLLPHITALLQQRLPIERHAIPNTCESYAYAFRLLFEYASDCTKHRPLNYNWRSWMLVDSQLPEPS
jgi:integrase/recombinase XerD